MITLTTAQQTVFNDLLAFANGRSNNALAVLEGFAGTGKTTLVGELINALQGLRVAVMAPTNKAVAVVQEKTGLALGVEFGSLHSFLGLRLKENEDGTQSCLREGVSTLHEYDFAVIDEASMVAESLFESILHLKRHCKVLFVGDPAQLPPVSDEGRDSPVFRTVPMKFRLNEIVRQAEGNPIIAASIVVRAAIEAGQRAQLSTLVAAFPKGATAAGVMGGGMAAIVETILYEAHQGRSCRAIAWRNDAVEQINGRVFRALFPDCQTPFAVGETLVAQGEFKSVREPGCPSMRVFNSEELVVSSIQLCAHPLYPAVLSYRVQLAREDLSLIVVFIPANELEFDRKTKQLWSEYREAKAQNKRDSRAVSDSAWAFTRAFAPLRHCYAMTAHKSQGSTFDTALVYWDDLMRQRSDFEFNRLLYVSMTRAAKHMALVTQ